MRVPFSYLRPVTNLPASSPTLAIFRPGGVRFNMAMYWTSQMRITACLVFIAGRTFYCSYSLPVIFPRVLTESLPNDLLSPAPLTLASTPASTHKSEFCWEFEGFAQLRCFPPSLFPRASQRKAPFRIDHPMLD